MKRLICLLIALVMAVTCLVACGGVTPEKQAEKTVNSCFAALKAGDMDTAMGMMKGDDMPSIGGDSEDAAINETMVEAVFGKLKYKILSSTKIDNNTVTVKVELRNLDMKPVCTDFFTQALQYVFKNALADPQPSEEELDQKMTEIFTSCVNKEDLTTVTNEVDIKVVKDGDSWMIETDEKLADALLGGLVGVLEELADSLSSIG